MRSESVYDGIYGVTEMMQLPSDPRKAKRANEKALPLWLFTWIVPLVLVTLVPALVYGARIEPDVALRFIPGIGLWWLWKYDLGARYADPRLTTEVHLVFIIAIAMAVAGGLGIAILAMRRYRYWLKRDDDLTTEHGSSRWQAPEDFVASAKRDPRDNLLPEGYDIFRGFSAEDHHDRLAQSRKARDRKIAVELEQHDEQSVNVISRASASAESPQLSALREMASTYGMADPDPILVKRPEIEEDRPHAPRDLDPEFMSRYAGFYARAHSIVPAYVLGSYINPYRRESVVLSDRSDRFLLLGMPTRSGKGVSFGFPNALGSGGAGWHHSLFINDPKKESCAGTAHFRKFVLGQRIFIVEPFATDGRNARFNPLAQIRLCTRYEVTDAMAIATAIVDPDGAGFDGDSGVWKKRARTLMTGVILHILYSPDIPEKSLRSVDAFFSDWSSPVSEKYQRMKTAIHDPEGIMGWQLNGRPTRTHPVVAFAAHDQAERPEGEAGSVKSEMQSFTEIYRNPTLAENTATSDFSIGDIMDGPVPATVYFVVTPDTVEICKPYIRLFLNLLINRNTGALTFDKNARPEAPHRWKLGMLLDEFSSTLGRLTIFANQLAFVAGYDIRPAVIVQDQSQLRAMYQAEADNIVSNMHTLMFGATNNEASQKFYSNLCGSRTYAERQGHGRGSHTRSGSVPLLSPDAIRRIPPDETIVIRAGDYPIPVKKLKYYAEDSVYASRVRRTDFASDRLPPEDQHDVFRQRELQADFMQFMARKTPMATATPTTNDILQRQLLQSGYDVPEDLGDAIMEELAPVSAPATVLASTTPRAPEPPATPTSAPTPAFIRQNSVAPSKVGGAPAPGYDFTSTVALLEPRQNVADEDD